MAKAKTRTKAATPSRKAAVAWDEPAAQVMKHYAERGVFKGQIGERRGQSESAFKVLWHRARPFEFRLDRKKRTLTLPEVLPGVKAKSPLYADYRAFIAGFQDGSRMAHRSIAKSKAVIGVANRRGKVALELKVKDGDFGYALKQLLAVVHETYMCFVTLGPYDDYRVAHLGADPDWGR